MKLVTEKNTPDAKKTKRKTIGASLSITGKYEVNEANIIPWPKEIKNVAKITGDKYKNLEEFWRKNSDKISGDSE